METIKTPCGHEYDEEVCPARRKAQIEFRKTGRRVDFPGCITCPYFVTKSADKPQEEKLKNKTKPVTVRTCEKSGCNVVISKDSKTGRCRACSARINAKAAHQALRDKAAHRELAAKIDKAELTPKPTERCPKCGKKLTKNGFCYTCAAHEREEKKGKARKKPICNEPAPKVTQKKSNVTLAPKTGAPKTLPNLPASRLCKEFRIQNCHDCDDLTCDDNLRTSAGAGPLPEIIPGVLLYQSSTPSQMLPKQSTMSRAHLLRLHENLTEQARELMTRKNADYGANADPFANFRMSALLHIEPEFGVLLRMQDKMARLVSFLEKGELAVKEESWSDAIIDIINYSVLLCGLLQEKVNQGGAKL